MSGTTPQYSKTLAEQVDLTAKFLRNPEGGEPKRKVAGVEVDFVTMADDLEGGQQQLTEVRAELVQATKRKSSPTGSAPRSAG